LLLIALTATVLFFATPPCAWPTRNGDLKHGILTPSFLYPAASTLNIASITARSIVQARCLQPSRQRSPVGARTWMDTFGPPTPVFLGDPELSCRAATCSTRPVNRL